MQEENVVYVMCVSEYIVKENFNLHHFVFVERWKLTDLVEESELKV